MVAYLARRISGYIVKEIADYFQRSSVTLGEAIIKVEDLFERDTNQSIIVWTLKTKSLLPPLRKGGIPLFGILFLSLDRQRGVRGDFRRTCLINYGLLSKSFEKVLKCMEGNLIKGRK